MAEKAPVIVVKKKKVVAGGGHGGAWKVAYADFVTAMMCFFLVMWLLGSDEEVREAVARYFNNPTSAWRPDLLNPQNVPLGEHTGAGDSALDGTDGAIPEDLIERPSKPNAESPPGTVKLAEESFGLSPHLSPPADLKIDSMRFSLPEATLFEPGKAQLSGRAGPYLERLAGLLRNYDGHVVIKGYTQPFEAGAGDPYEFALARAVALADHFSERKWIDRDRVRTVVVDLRARATAAGEQAPPNRELQVSLVGGDG